MITDRQALGQKGEDVAAQWLKDHGWNVLDRRFRSGHRDIDIIATYFDRRLFEHIVVFVEVRTRTSELYGTAAESVQVSKQLEVRRAARDWFRINSMKGGGSFVSASFRFDVIGVLMNGTTVHVDHYPDAF